MFKSKCIQHRYLIAFFLFLIAFYGYNIQRVYGFAIYPDEFGYWAYAARALGYDWSEIVSLGSYYSYGYSLILFPILKFCKDGIIAYRVAVTVNFVLLGIDALLLNRLLDKILRKKHELSEMIPRDSIPLLVAVAIFYPPNLFYAETTMVETMLMSMFIIISFLLYHYLENNSLPVLTLLLIATVYIHFLHMRTVGVAIALAITLFIVYLKNTKKSKQFIIIFCVGISLLIAGLFLKTILQSLLYGNASDALLQVNDYGGQIGKIKYILTPHGMFDFACSLCGKVLYLGLASFGLLYFGIAACIKEIKKNRNPFYCFLLLSLIGEILIDAIYTARPGRVDSLVYGRYDEFVMPIFMAIGVMEFMNCTRKTGKAVAIILSQLAMTGVVMYQVKEYHLTNIHGYFMVGMSYLHNLNPDQTEYSFASAYVFGVVLMLCVMGILHRINKKKRIYLFVLLIMIEFLLFARASQNYWDEPNLGAFRDSIMTEKIESLLQKEEDRKIVYLKEDKDNIIQSIQFLLPDQKIHVLKAKESIGEYSPDEIGDHDIILLDFDSTYGEKLEEKYQHNMLEGRFQIFYN